MADLGVDEVCHEEDVEEHALDDQHRGAEERPGLLELEEGQQVDPLVLCLLQKGVDPPVVALHPAEAVHVADHAGHHARDARHGLEEDDAVEVHGLRGAARLEARQQVEAEAERLRDAVRDFRRPLRWVGKK